MEVYQIIFLIWAHFAADFVLQSDAMAKNKSKSNAWLSYHIAIYSAFILVVTASPIYALVNGVAHFATDWVSSRLTSRLWAKGQVHNFFVVIGFDQAVHLTTLVLTYVWIFG